MKWRSANRQSWPRVPRQVLEVKQLDFYTLVHLRALAVTEPLIVTCCGQRLTIMDAGYHWFTLCEPGARHVTTLHCNAEGQLVQVYVDMIGGWIIGADGFPQFGDLYLDVIALLDGRAEIIDGEDLEAALALGAVTRRQYDEVWREARGVYGALRAGTFVPLNRMRLEAFIR